MIFFSVQQSRHASWDGTTAHFTLGGVSGYRFGEYYNGMYNHYSYTSDTGMIGPSSNDASSFMHIVVVAIIRLR